MIGEWSEEDRDLTMLPSGYRESFKEAKMYLAFFEGVSVGCTSYFLVEDFGAQCSVYVVEEHRRLGYGKMIIDAIHDKAREAGAIWAYSPIRSDNQKMINLTSYMTSVDADASVVIRGEVL